MPPVVFGQDDLHEEVVVTASTIPVPFGNTARTVRVLARRDIEELPVRSVSDLLRYMANVEVKARGPNGVQSDYSIRGSSFSQVLILIDGFRVNDSQTAHHNSDIPLAIEDIERVEVLYGPGSTLYGGDALAGAINIITRKANGEMSGRIAGGQHGLITGSFSSGFSAEGWRSDFSFWGDRSNGFEFDRDYRNIGFSFRSAWGDTTTAGIHFIDKEFGANGFYGASPSKEWTNTALATFGHELVSSGNWSVSTHTSYRTHGDHFRWDINRPGFAENLHRSHAVMGLAKALWSGSDVITLSMGFEGGSDWISSSNLGQHQYLRQSVFLEAETRLGSGSRLYPGVRFDHYNEFGNAWSPSLNFSSWVTEAVKLRGSVSRSFRIPTFTELFYSDPNHQAGSDLTPETAVGVEGGVDYYLSQGTLLRLSVFSRRQEDAIDWIRRTPEERWRSTNIRRVDNFGIELDLKMLISSMAKVDLQYGYLQSTTEDLTFLSKYVLDFPRHTVSGWGWLKLPGNFSVGSHLAYRLRDQRADYFVLDARIARRTNRFTPYLEISNALNADYQEIQGVNMPGRWIRAGLDFKVH